MQLIIFLTSFSVPITSQITPFSGECFLTPLLRTIKNSGRAGNRQTVKNNNKVKKKQTRIKLIISASPSSVFYTKFTISDLKNKYVLYPN